MKKARIIFTLLFFLGMFGNFFSASGTSLNNKAAISDSIDILNYSIHLDMVHLSYKTIAGYADLQITPRVAALNSFRLWLLALTVDSVLINSVPVTNIAYNDTLIRINLPAPVSSGDTFTARIWYHGHPVIDPSSWGGFYFSNDSVFAYNIGVGFESEPHNFGRVWFPCIDDFVDRATYDCYITTKSSNMAVCGGTLQDSVDNGNGTRTWHWRMHNTIPSYLASVAVGPYVPVAGIYPGIAASVPTYIYVRTADTLKARNSFINLNNILSVYETRFGPYRFERVGYVGVPFNSGAMEHATNIAYPLSVINGTLTYESLYGHELSHMWFGDLVTCETAGDMWLNEGTARYCESVYMEGLYGKETFRSNMRSMHKEVVQFSHVIDNGYRAIYGIPSEYTYGNTVYEKGADVFHTLRGYLGDSLFFHSLKNYFADFAFDHISSAEFRDYLSLQTGVNLNSFFDAWVFAPGFLHFSIDSFRVSGSGPANVTVYLRQRLDHAPAYANENILEITFMNDLWQQYTDTVRFSGMTGSKTFQVPFVPATAMLDLNEKISDAITSNSMVIKSAVIKDFVTTYCALPVTAVSDSAFVFIEHNFVPPDPLKIPNADIKRLSDHRYWKVSGIFPSGFITKAKFFYNRSTSTTNGYLDNTLMTTSTSRDSLMLLYRRNTADDWSIVPFTIAGTASSGNLVIDTLHPGEYTLAIGKPSYSGVEELKREVAPLIKVFPNPSRAKFTVEWSGADVSLMKIYNDSGTQVDSLPVRPGQNQMVWKPHRVAAGNYILKLLDSRGHILGTERIIYLP